MDFPTIHIHKKWIAGRLFAIVRFPYDARIVKEVRRFAFARWDSQKKVWMIPYSESVFSEFISRYGSYIEAEPEFLLIPLKTELYRRNYSRKTERSYFYHNLIFLRKLNLHPYRITESDLSSYLDGFLHEKRVSSVTIRSILQAFKFYYNSVLNKDFLKRYSSPKKEKRIPQALSRKEVRAMIDVTINPKHKLLLSICYGTGLRVGELVNLKGSDIDWERRSVRVRRGKGMKDRFTILPSFCKSLLTNAIDLSGPDRWIFPGQIPGSHLSVRTAEKVFEISKVRAKIKKSVSIHDLRHAFAIHLLESGTSIKLIQNLLGHASVRTTEIYARITDPTLALVKSPLDF
ncbi:integrase [Leptospira perolatii]|uniref:Integrase n=1 Tax=Leptospira perolatii TaxID=2023191 RepID=A0A2M9ZPL3_9LEPT|nr:tyrosine-type recombinase/integrase [Leptospira perolatii]PJZ70809.1 integrase [Leptospira perolatii]PJZ74018.1 integrase [Leptospira perolatii]